jgi:predicted ATPase
MRIAVTGPQNTGKTTFIQDFLTAYPNYIHPERTYRDVVREKNLQINQLTGEESQKSILDFLYEQIMETPGDNVIFDRCVIDNYAYTYSAYLKGNVSKELVMITKRKMFESLRLIDTLLFIPTAACVPLVQDDQRDIDVEYIDLINKTFIETLFDVATRTHIPILVVTGTREERIKHLKEKLA